MQLFYQINGFQRMSTLNLRQLFIRWRYNVTKGNANVSCFLIGKHMTFTDKPDSNTVG